MRGEGVPDALPFLRLFTLCEAMKWAHLPLPGGLADQHPDFIEFCFMTFSARADHEEKKAKEEQRKQDMQARQGRSRVPGRRR